MMPIDFNVKPRHVQMFGAQGVLAPLYQRQAQKFALSEEERRIQAQFEQMKALTQLRANLETQLQAADPYRQAQTRETEATTELRGFQLEQAKGEDVATADFARNYAAAPEEKRPEIVRQEFARRGILQGLMSQEQQETQGQQLVPILDTEGKFTGRYEWSSGRKSPPAGYFDKTQTGQQAPNIPTTWQDFQKIEDQALQGISGYVADQDINSPVLKELGIKARGTVGNFVKRYMGGSWGSAKSDEVNKIMAYISDPKNAKVIAKDKQIETIANAMRTLQPAYDELFREMILNPPSATPDTTQVRLDDIGWKQFIQGGAGGGY